VKSLGKSFGKVDFLAGGGGGGALFCGDNLGGKGSRQLTYLGHYNIFANAYKGEQKEGQVVRECRSIVGGEKFASGMLRLGLGKRQKQSQRSRGACQTTVLPSENYGEEKEETGNKKKHKEKGDLEKVDTNSYKFRQGVEGGKKRCKGEKQEKDSHIKEGGKEKLISSLQEEK